MNSRVVGRRFGFGVAVLALCAALAAVFVSGSPAGAQASPFWTQTGTDIDGEAGGDESGEAVAISADGNTVIVGAFRNDGNGTNSGHARIYTYDGTNWVQVGADIDGENAFDESGTAVAISADGNTVIIGARVNSGNGLGSGHARIYTYDGTNWIQVGADIDGENAFDQSGTAVAISADGNTVAIGARVNSDNGTFSGHARIFNFDGTNWVQVCLLYTSPSPRDLSTSRMPSSA